MQNGNTVPSTVDALGAVAVTILAAGNPLPGVATLTLVMVLDLSATTRIRLAGTQDVIAVAKMADGSFAVSKTVKATIGGCGGQRGDITMAKGVKPRVKVPKTASAGEMVT